MEFKPGTALTAEQTGHSVKVLGHLANLDYGVQFPGNGQRNSASQQFESLLPCKLSHAWTVELWGDNGKGKRLKSWGHRDGKLSAHFIAVRGGIGFHTDPGQSGRYSVHLELFNGGWLTCGLLDQPDSMPHFLPGLVTVLDTFSPHRVIRDPRLEFRSPTKIAAAMDFKESPSDLAGAVRELVQWTQIALALPVAV
jgi:hypothetical protein